MSSTTVHSNNKDNGSVAGSVFVATENTLEIPPEGKGQVYEVISSRIEEGNMEIPVGNAKLQENGTLQMENGTTIVMVNPRVWQELLNAKKQREEMGRKAKVQSGMSRD